MLVLLSYFYRGRRLKGLSRGKKEGYADQFRSIFQIPPATSSG
jgi:hypothetical protein